MNQFVSFIIRCRFVVLASLLFAPWTTLSAFLSVGGTTTSLLSRTKDTATSSGRTSMIPRNNNNDNGHYSRMTTLLRLAPRRRQSRNNNNNNNDNNGGGENVAPAAAEIPQLPSFGSSSFDATAAIQRKFSSSDQSPTTTPAFVGRKFELQYTCKVCETRNVHKVSRIAYNKGVVITVCKGCTSQHLISDHLGFTQQFDGNLETYFQEQGSKESVHRVSGDVFNLEKVLALDTKSGSIFDNDSPNGGTKTHME